MPSIRSTLITLASSLATAHAEHLRAVFSSGSFSTITGPNGEGGGSGFETGLTILNDNNEAIYHAKNPANYSPCFAEGRTFEIEGDCWDTPFRFYCDAKLSGSPEYCAVQDANGKQIGYGEGKTETTFIGIAIALDATCVVEFESNGGGCPLDNSEAGALHATGMSV
ncbi:hypothetical protein E2P81_ATG10644 [Venturia nashicola]|nr:hypothetical protein E2P81_ATG10644 [Venturia nashicola]